MITGGAGFIGTTLARELVDRNEVVAYDNLHRDALSGTDLADHPNFSFVQGDILDPEHVREVAAGATHLVHAAAIAGVLTLAAVLFAAVALVGESREAEARLAAWDSAASGS